MVPRLASLLVLSRLCNASQAKILLFLGAREFHISEFPRQVVPPKFTALYQFLTENSFPGPNLICLMSSSSLRTTRLVWPAKLLVLPHLTEKVSRVEE
jgi:hypothetical protein